MDPVPKPTVALSAALAKYGSNIQRRSPS
jgi:hypothetical protein